MENVYSLDSFGLGETKYLSSDLSAEKIKTCQNREMTNLFSIAVAAANFLALLSL